MAFSKVFVATLLLLLLIAAAQLGDARSVLEGEVLDSSESAGRSPHQKINCGAACAGRCRLASRRRMCKRACGTCCARCNCVPPGTYGNKEQCACYANMTTHGGRPKCP